MVVAYIARVCYSSLDGGATWQRASILGTQFTPQHPECGTSGESLSAGDGGYPQGDFGRRHPGRLWVVISCNNTNYLAASDDEGATWPILKKTDGSPLTIPSSNQGSSSPVGFAGVGVEMRVDTSGNLYAFELAGSQLLMRISKDDGKSWTKPLNMTAPAARKTTVGQWAVAIGKPGEIAVSYFAARSDGTGNDGFITVTHNALTKAGTPNPNPMFYAATVNSPDRRLQSAKPVGTDYIGVDIGPDGTPWASFYSDCFTKPNGQFEDASCAQNGGQSADGVPPIPGPGNAMTVGHLSFRS
jgi:hypothetical protein